MNETIKNTAASFIKITLFSIALTCGVCMVVGGMPVLGMGAIVAGCGVLNCDE